METTVECDEDPEEFESDSEEKVLPVVKHARDAASVAEGDGYLRELRRIASSVFETRTPDRRVELERAFQTHARVIYGTEVYERNADVINERNGWGAFDETTDKRMRVICVWRLWGKTRLLRALAAAFAVVIPNVTVAVTGASLEAAQNVVWLAAHDVVVCRAFPHDVVYSDHHPANGRKRYHVSSADTREIRAISPSAPRGLVPASRSRTRPIVYLINEVYALSSGFWNQFTFLFASSNDRFGVTAATTTDVGGGVDPDDVTATFFDSTARTMTAWRMRVGASLPAPHLMDVVVYQPSRELHTPGWTDGPIPAIMPTAIIPFIE